MEPALKTTCSTSTTRRSLIAVAATAVLLTVVAAAPAVSSQAGTSISAYVPPIKHVFVINLEKKGYERTWGAGSAAPYLAQTLRSQGVLLNTYYGTAHNSQPNYVAQISGQGPNSQMQADCQAYSGSSQPARPRPGRRLATVASSPLRRLT